MNISLKPEVQKFVQEQVQGGRFQSAEAVLDEALHRMMLDAEGAMDEGTVAAINRAEEQLDRGEGRDFEKFATQMRKRLATR